MTDLSTLSSSLDAASAASDASDGAADPPGCAGRYAAVAEAISYLQRHSRRQPGLAEVAAAVGLSQDALQRSFSRFAGVSPKRFLQFLSKEHALRLLGASHDVLDAALASGLSGPGRLHDLMVSCEALTPGEIRRGAAGVTLAYAYADTPLGRALAATSPRGLAFLGFVDPQAGGDAAAWADLRGRWPGANLVADAQAASALLQAFAGWDTGVRAAPLPLLLRGTNLQLKVWEALLAVPAGTVLTYGRLAAAVGRPGAVRAVASAVGRNPISVLIPCHRVLRAGGALGGYHWGLPRKAALLAWESAQSERRPG